MNEAQILDAVDHDAFARVAAKHADAKWAKYLDLPYWLHKNYTRAVRLGLHEGPRLRVLDLGCGCGYFLHVCRMLGHLAHGVDWFSSGSMLDDVSRVLGVDIEQHRIHPGVSIPGAADADVVTAHMVTFNGHAEQPWSVEEWRWFLDQFRIGTRIGLEMNREPDGIMYQRGVAELFGSRGAVIEDKHVVFQRLR